MLLISIGPAFATIGTGIGEAWARECEANRKRWAMSGAATGALLAFLAIFLFLLCPELPHWGWPVIREMAAIEGVHFGLVGLVSLVGVQVAYDPYRSHVVYRGPLLACFLAFPVYFLPLIFLTLY